jgi:hypothetical protein
MSFLSGLCVGKAAEALDRTVSSSGEEDRECGDSECLLSNMDDSRNFEGTRVIEPGADPFGRCDFLDGVTCGDAYVRG